MTSKLEKEFLNTFKINGCVYCANPRLDCYKRLGNDCTNECEFYCGTHLPQITDNQYLELIVHLSGVTKPHFVFERGVEELKQDILTQCMDYVEALKPFVRDMFE